MMKFARPSVIALLLLLGPAAALRADPLDDTILALMAKRKITGLSLAVIKDGVIVKAKGYGVTALVGGSPVTTDTLFQAGSDSKALAAMGALYLVDQKKLTLDGNVNDLLRSWHVPENSFTAGHPVTLRELLSHTAGMTVHGFRGYSNSGPVPTLEQVLNGEPPANSPAIRVEAVPGSKWNYSGGGYVVAQQLMIDVSGQTFPEFMQENVLHPLGMNASTFAQPLPASRAGLAATAYPRSGQPVAGGWNVYPEMAPAGLWTTASDLARFAISLQQSFAGQPHPVLTAAAARLMITPVMNHYALGLGVKGEGKSAMFSHGGRNEGFDTLLNAYTDTGLGVVIMINANDNSKFMVRVQDAVALAYGWPDYHPYVSPSPIPDLEPKVTEQLKVIYLAAMDGKLDQTLFTPSLAKSLATVIPGQVTDELKASGPPKSFYLVEHKEFPGGHRVYQYVITTGETVILRCSYDANGRIERLGLQPE